MIDRGLVVREAPDIIKKFLCASETIGYIVCCEAAAYYQFGIHIFEILCIPFFVGIGKDEVKWAFQLLYQLMGIGQPGVNKVFYSCLLEILQSCLVPVFIDFNGDQFSACSA